MSDQDNETREADGEASGESDAAETEGSEKLEWPTAITGRFRREPGSFFNWLRNTARLWGFLGFILLILIYFRAVVLPFILSVLLTYVLAPVLNALCRVRFGRRRLPRWLWLIVLYVALFALNGLFFTSFVPRVSKNIKQVIVEAPSFWKKARKEYMPKAAGWLQQNFGVQPAKSERTLAKKGKKPPANKLHVKRLPDGSLELDVKDLQLDVVKRSDNRWTIRARRPEKARPETFEQRINRYVSELFKSSERGLNQVLRLGQAAIVGLMSALTTFILTLMISAFLLVDTERILAGLRALVDRRFHQDFDNVIHLIDRGLSGAIRGQLLICVVNGILTWVGLMIFGIKYAFLLALLAGVMSLIPIFGSILSSFPIVLVALTSGEGQGIAIHLGLLMLGWIIGIHLLEANLLNPKIIGTAAKIHPVIVIFSVVAGERTYGAIGALLAVPLVSAVQAVFLYVRGKVRGTQ